MINGIDQAKTEFVVVFLFVISFAVTVFSPSGSVFANELGLIDSDELSRERSRWVVLDARPKSEWTQEHIPGALSFSWEDYTMTDKAGVPYKVLPPQEMARALGGMGITEKTPVAVYGDADKSWGGEGWVCWVLSWLGHEGPVRLLNGGIQSWKNRGLPLVRGKEDTIRTRLEYRYRLNPLVDITTQELRERKSDVVLIDTRSRLEVFKGKIPGALHIPWNEFFTGKDRHPLPPDELKALLKRKRVDTSKTVVYYCTGGIRSAYAWYVHRISGISQARNYEGGYEEWKKLGAR